MINKDGQPWFVGKDIAEKLGYKNMSDAIARNVDDEDKLQIAKHDLKNQNDIGTKGTVAINESGVLIMLVLGLKGCDYNGKKYIRRTYQRIY